MSYATGPEIAQLRHSIDNIDAALVYLLAERFALTGRVGQIKAERGLPPEDQVREDAQIARSKKLAADAGLEPEFAEAFREFIVAEVIRRHRRIAAERAASGGGAVPMLDTVA